MTTFEDAYVKLKELMDKAGKKAGQVLELQKLKLSAADLRGQVNKEYAKLGKSVYLTACDGLDRSADDQATIDLINIKMKDIQEMEEAISEYQNRSYCKACGFVNLSGAVFCSKCGERLSKPEAQSQPEPEAPEETPADE